MTIKHFLDAEATNREYRRVLPATLLARGAAKQLAERLNKDSRDYWEYKVEDVTNADLRWKGAAVLDTLICKVAAYDADENFVGYL